MNSKIQDYRNIKLSGEDFVVGLVTLENVNCILSTTVLTKTS